MASANGSIIGAAWNGSTWAYSSTAQRYAGYSGDTYYVTFIQFKTPSFSGVSSSIDFNIYLQKGVGNTANLRYAICTSDANHSKYHQTTSAVTDSYQLTSGTVFFAVTSSFASKKISVSTDELKPNTTYYLALWSSDATGVAVRGTGNSEGAASMTLYYKYTYTVTYNANGHGTAPSAVTVADGTSITLPTLTAAGYIFLGWATSSTATSGMTGSYTVTASVTLYAVWKVSGSYEYLNIDGVAVKHAVYVNVNGSAVRATEYVNVAGSAVKC